MNLDPELRTRLRVPAIASVALLLLLGVNVLLGLTLPFTAAGYVEIGVAAVMVAIVLLYTMEIRHEDGLIRLFSALGFFWLLILFGMTSIDYFSR
jgi:cytochrome c oxidase subunit 4